MSKGHPELILPMKDGGEKRAVKESVFESGTDTGRMTAEGAKGAERGLEVEKLVKENDGSMI